MRRGNRSWETSMNEKTKNCPLLLNDIESQIPILASFKRKLQSRSNPALEAPFHSRSAIFDKSPALACVIRTLKKHGVEVDHARSRSLLILLMAHESSERRLARIIIIYQWTYKCAS